MLKPEGDFSDLTGKMNNMQISLSWLATCWFSTLFVVSPKILIHHRNWRFVFEPICCFIFLQVPLCKHNFVKYCQKCFNLKKLTTKNKTKTKEPLIPLRLAETLWGHFVSNYITHSSNASRLILFDTLLNTDSDRIQDLRSQHVQYRWPKQSFKLKNLAWNLPYMIIYIYIRPVKSPLSHSPYYKAYYDPSLSCSWGPAACVLYQIMLLMLQLLPKTHKPLALLRSPFISVFAKHIYTRR